MRQMATWCFGSLLLVLPTLALSAAQVDVDVNTERDEQRWYNPADWFDDTPNTWNDPYAYYDGTSSGDEGWMGFGDEGIFEEITDFFEPDSEVEVEANGESFEVEFYTDDWFDSESTFDDWYQSGR